MDPAQLPALPAVIGSDRFGTYLAATAGDIAQAVRLYAWNVEVSAAFWGPLQVLEVALRNALHVRMEALFGRADWWNAPNVALQHAQREQVAKAVDTLTRRKPGFGPGHVVAELTFGFWSGLLGRGNGYEHRFWIPALRHAFPGYTGSRPALQSRTESLRLFRNRIAHHEPIFGRHLAADHDSMLLLAGWLEPDVRRWIDDHSRVPGTLARRDRCVSVGDACAF